MKATTNVTKKKPETKYPCIKQSRLNGTIILFTAHNEGVILEAGDSLCEAGEFSESWNESVFDFFDGTITLEND